ncbi:FK506-binding protein [Photobacterium damselae subsp. piscicida]|uniref:Peptidyl-prolyl cis-trans isomerase n=3 Tax=Photobacterium damselae TaxID=38293 RepID=D0YX70_PHODD|nr:FKBP-type peptidyl-prolyl cis-trans isomerase [Photobacterium damselae]EEZ40823.1 putative peptidyl-prolyl cis-trans isomerase FKBP-type [Photobacterium damselae subsp. damselae CIP 102761]MBE8129459.1 FKBP-type peptidyl-prolyl cis-trans isomerase [Photobacterium damselae subsp. piscicida]MDP2532940.1 FKBP-type peptidyl-prolyl cis-trans isomerase [Photobacterium damselae subsp. piscicida]MDP2559003.1 FKBP-type peptidyl-prolyl cis-trans isomerase [Photobacterium damselae subsp. piscicida]MDP
MVEGEKVRLFIPANLAYGNNSAGIIKPGSTLIFDVELFKIN